MAPRTLKPLAASHLSPPSSENETDAKPAATKDRKVTFSGTLRQGPDGPADILGFAHFLLDPSVTDASNEQISGELLLSAPPPAP